MPAKRSVKKLFTFTSEESALIDRVRGDVPFVVWARNAALEKAGGSRPVQVAEPVVGEASFREIVVDASDSQDPEARLQYQRAEAVEQCQQRLVSKFEGSCFVCEAVISIGDVLWWWAEGKRTVCEVCHGG